MLETDGVGGITEHLGLKEFELVRRAVREALSEMLEELLEQIARAEAEARRLRDRLDELD